MPGGPVVQDWMLEALAVALRDAGCPAPVAHRLARGVRLAERDGEWLALLGRHGTGVEEPVRRDDWAEAARHLAENVAADNAEAVDRAARGEAGQAPLWALPDRAARRRAGPACR
ncbi:hypothetical protein ACWKWC_09185 [Geodermatophilus nigrescens]